MNSTFWMFFVAGLLLQATVAVVAFIKQARLVGWAFAITVVASIFYPLAVLFDGFHFAPRLIEAIVTVVDGMIILVSYSLMLAYVVKLKPGSIR